VGGAADDDARVPERGDSRRPIEIVEGWVLDLKGDDQGLESAVDEGDDEKLSSENESRENGGAHLFL
jgi:hypothetical protein